MMFSKR